MNRNPNDKLGRFFLRLLKGRIPRPMRQYLRTKLAEEGRREEYIRLQKQIVLDDTKTGAERRAAIDILIAAFRGDDITIPNNFNPPAGGAEALDTP